MPSKSAAIVNQVSQGSVETYFRWSGKSLWYSYTIFPQESAV